MIDGFSQYLPQRFIPEIAFEISVQAHVACTHVGETAHEIFMLNLYDTCRRAGSDHFTPRLAFGSNRYYCIRLCRTADSTAKSSLFLPTMSPRYGLFAGAECLVHVDSHFTGQLGKSGLLNAFQLVERRHTKQFLRESNCRNLSKFLDRAKRLCSCACFRLSSQ